MIDTTEIRNAANLHNPKFGISEAINTIEMLCDRVDELERRLKQFNDAIFDSLESNSFPKSSTDDLTDSGGIAPTFTNKSIQDYSRIVRCGEAQLVPILENSADETFRKETAREFFLADHTDMFGFGDMDKAIDLADEFILKLERCNR